MLVSHFRTHSLGCHDQPLLYSRTLLHKILRRYKKKLQMTYHFKLLYSITKYKVNRMGIVKYLVQHTHILVISRLLHSFLILLDYYTILGHYLIRNRGHHEHVRNSRIFTPFNPYKLCRLSIKIIKDMINLLLTRMLLQV